MRTIAELNLLLRAETELPDGMKLATDEFHEGWNFVRTGNAPRLKEKIQARGWNFIRVADGSLRSGVGDTSQQAIADALRLALRHVSEHFNAAEVEHIELTQYPWFFLARVRVYPYRIQQDAVLTVAEEAEPMEVPERLGLQPAEMLSQFGSAMPLLKEMLVASHNSEARMQ
jgi:hypothetical protein